MTEVELAISSYKMAEFICKWCHTCQDGTSWWRLPYTDKSVFVMPNTAGAAMLICQGEDLIMEPIFIIKEKDAWVSTASCVDGFEEFLPTFEFCKPLRFEQLEGFLPDT